jgi:hypothetical protein
MTTSIHCVFRINDRNHLIFNMNLILSLTKCFKVTKTYLNFVKHLPIDNLSDQAVQSRTQKWLEHFRT